MADVYIENHGSVWIFRPLTQAAKGWVDENVEVEGWQRYGDGFAVAPHYVEELGCGMTAAGLEVEET